MRALDNSGTHDTTHKQTSRTSIWDKLRCNCSSNKEKRLALKLKKPLKKIKKKFLEISSYKLYTNKTLFSNVSKTPPQKYFRNLFFYHQRNKIHNAIRQ